MPDLSPVESIFFAALDLPPDNRGPFLDKACRNDPELRARIEKMLAAQSDLGNFLDQPVVSPVLLSPAVTPAVELAGVVIGGKYKLLKQIGAGGMGTVWLADQLHPVRRRVAVKLIRGEYASSQDILARFEAERQAIARMEHPHIAKLLDAGTMDDGGTHSIGGNPPYFVMELVDGVPLNEYCDAHKLSIPDRLRLFVQICRAVQHAHQKGIIHRDLKPSNILIEHHDGRPVPRVIDFGVAKATGGTRLLGETLFTQPGNVAGTPLYMAPEQADFSATDIDTRADVYALGVNLYELLTGTTPIEREQLKKVSLLEIFQTIRDTDPPTPSKRLSSTGLTAAAAAQRQTEPAKLGRFVRGDLDWIVMKALARERERRYETAASFAGDIERFLNHEPVLAGPPSAAYRLSKFARRNRVQVIAAGLVLAALVAGIVGTTVGLVEARRERDAKEAARQAEADQRALAESRLAKLEKGVEILGSVFADIDPSAEKRGGDPVPVAIGKQLARAADELKGDAVGDPLVGARIQSILGQSLSGVGRHAKAIEVLEQAAATRAELLGDEHVDTLLLRASLASAYLQLGKVDRAISLFKAVVPPLSRQLSATDRDVLRIRGQYALALVTDRREKDAIPLLTALEEDFRAAGRAEDRSALVARNILAHAYLTAKDFRRAITVLEILVPDCERILGLDHPDTLIPRNNLAMAYHMASKYDLALKLQRRTYEALLAKHGDDHPTTLGARSNLGIAARDAGQFDEAVRIFESLLRVREGRDGPVHQTTLLVRGRLGVTYRMAGRLDRAIPVLEQTLASWLNIEPADGPNALVALTDLAMAYTAAGQPARAVPRHEAAYAATQKRPGAPPLELIQRRLVLGSALVGSGQFDRAAKLHAISVMEAEDKLGPDHLLTIQSLSHLGVAYRYLGRTGEAITLLQRASDRAATKFGEMNLNTLAYRAHLLGARREAGELATARAGLEALIGPAEKVCGPTDATTLAIVQYLAEIREHEKDWDRAIAGRQRVVDAEQKRIPAGPALPIAQTRLGFTLLAAGRPAAAEPLLRQTLATWEGTKAELWGAFFTRAVLGAALAGQKKYAEAESFLLEGYRGLQARADLIPYATFHPLPWCREQLAQLYEAWGKPDEAAKWRAEQAKSTFVAPHPRAKAPAEK